jgi:hypothetical protein
MNPARGRGHLIIFIAVSILAGMYYQWAVRAPGHPFEWTKDDPGYYNYLGRAFAEGHLYLPVEPQPKLLEQPNPWDPRVDDSLKLFDAVLYQRRFYLYHGAAPAVVLFAPYRFLTKHDLPENFALFLFCFGGFLFSAGAFFELIRLAGVKPRLTAIALTLLALAFCQGAPFLTSRVWVYEIAIAGAYFFLSGAVYFFARSFAGTAQWTLSAAGLMFGMAVACRPHTMIAGVLAAGILAFQGRKRLLAMAIPFVVAGLFIAAYNFSRFGSPFEFGTKWQLAGENQGRVTLSSANIRPGLFYLLQSKPEFSPVFPWVELHFPPRDFPRPATYFVEETVGGFYLAPFIFALPLIFFARRVRLPLLFLTAAAAGILLFVVMTGWSTQRYEVDFLPLLGLATLTAFAVSTSAIPFAIRGPATAILAAAIVFGCVVNLALGISGPYWDMVRNKPLRFVRIAARFSPVERYRPVLNPRFDVSLKVATAPVPEHFRDEWVTVGRPLYRYELYTERVAGKCRVFSNYPGSAVSADFPEEGLPADIRVSFGPGPGDVVVRRNGVEILRHRLGALVSAPSQIVVYRNRP